MRRRALGLAFAAGLAQLNLPLLGGCAATAGKRPSLVEIRAALAPGDTLRAAINYGNPVLAGRRPGSNEPVGVSVDLARELGRRLGVPVALVTFDSAGPVTAALRDAQIDLAFVAIDPARGGDLIYSAPYVVIEGAYLVRDNSPIRRNEDVDRLGHRIAVARSSTYDLYLTRALKAASLARAATSQDIVALFQEQGLDAVAGVRQQLLAAARRAPGLRVLDGAFLTVEQALAIPRGRETGHAYLEDFVEEMKASGFVADSLARHGIEGARVVPGLPPAARL